jgi:hypothetical protein
MGNWTEEDLAAYYARLKAPPAGTPLVPEKAAPVSEARIEAECCELLTRDGWRVLKTDPVSDRGRGKGFGEPGMADTLALRYSRESSAGCECLWLEWKHPGGRVRKHQVAWHIRERSRGAMTAIAGTDFPASVAGFAGWYRASGLARELW